MKYVHNPVVQVATLYSWLESIASYRLYVQHVAKAVERWI